MRITENKTNTSYNDIINILNQLDEIQTLNSSTNKFLSLFNFESTLITKYENLVYRNLVLFYDMASLPKKYNMILSQSYLSEFYGFNTLTYGSSNNTYFFYEVLTTPHYSVNSASLWSFVMKFDIFFVGLEIALLIGLLLFLTLKGFFKVNSINFTYQISVSNALSYYELIGFTTSACLLLIFDIIAATFDEDIADMAFCLVFFFVFTTVIGFMYGVGFVKAYASLSPVSNGESSKRLYLSDIINVFLCLLRVFLCWTRYIFYDLQVEHVDMALNYTDEVGIVYNNETMGLFFYFHLFLFCLLDLFFFGIQVGLCLFKFGIAVFLLWLILDLFLLRVSARVSEKWLINLLIKQIKSVL